MAETTPAARRVTPEATATGGGQAGQGARAEHLLGEQRADGHAGGQAGTAEHLRCHDHAQGPLVQRQPGLGGVDVLGDGHRASGSFVRGFVGYGLYTSCILRS
ncbi:hypothetical protein AB0J72_43190 [Dactylosporangium sp. NPDC049742]|uniref:hypothetical protein n=1 Tax=Dactylosporangium sp. NPDC049742 TaxID=3154737 RepID=UPI003413FE5C